MKKTIPFILSLFFIILISLPGYWLVRGKPSSEVSIVEGRVLGLPEKTYPTLKIATEYIQQGRLDLAIRLVWDLYTSGSLPKKFDGAATDQFPLRMPLIKFSRAIDRQIIRLSYLFSDDEVIPADMLSDIYIMKSHHALILPPGEFTDDGYKIINKRLENYQEISSRYPDINFYIFYVESLPFSQYHPLNKYFQKADRGRAFDYFKDNLTNQIDLGIMPMEGIEDHLINYYRTDHHWNTYGILEAYHGIYDLISSNYPNIPQKLTPTAMITFPEIEFLGSLARKTLYPVPGDDFIGFESDFPVCVVTDQGVEGKYDFRDEYLEGNYPTTPFLDHYAAYFGAQKGLLEYHCDTMTDRNILIIGDSYIRPLVPLIASQYEHTYFLDLRQKPDFSLSNFTSEHHIDDLLVASDYEVVFLDTEQWIINP